MKKLSRIFLVVLVFFTNIIVSQTKYRIITEKGETIEAENIRVQEKKNIIDILKVGGELQRMKYNKILSIREIIEGWEYFEFKEEGFTDYAVVNVDSIKSDDLYRLVKNWIKDTYNTPAEVIKSEIDKSKIRIEGLKKNQLRVSDLLVSLYYDATYSIEISVKDGKYKFDPIFLKYYVSTGYTNIPINGESLSGFYISSGKKKGNIQNLWRFIPPKLEELFNDLNLSLYKYIQENRKDGSSDSDSDDW